MIHPWQQRLWIATAPPGTWSSGPSVIYAVPGLHESETVEEYKRMGWEVVGPYILEDSMPR